MRRHEHLLWSLAEECAEVAQRASKASRFGLKEIEPGQKLNNAKRITEEVNDLIGIISILVYEKLIPPPSQKKVDKKILKIGKYLSYAKTCGTLE